MKTIHFRNIIPLVITILVFNLNVYAQNATLNILKNGTKIDPNDMSINKGDKITVQIVNNNPRIKYKISNLNLEVRTHQYQQIKTQKQAERHHKNITLSTPTFEQSPRIEVRVKDYASRFVSRFLLKFILVEQLKENEATKVTWITYGKEHEFWYY